MAEAKAYEQEYGQYEIIDGEVIMMSPAATIVPYFRFGM